MPARSGDAGGSGEGSGIPRSFPLGKCMQSVVFSFEQIGVVRSDLKSTRSAPKQGSEGAPDAWLEIERAYEEGLYGIAPGMQIIVITWLHKASRRMLKVHPRGDRTLPLTGVFSTRSPHRPNPLGIHRVTVLQVSGLRLKVGPLEAVDGTPVVDIKSAMHRELDA